MNPMISIIAPTFNHEVFIRDCIDSVMRQTFSDWELIVIDDCSDDGTEDIVRSFAETDKRIIRIRHDNRWGAYRLNDIYNEGLGIAHGKYIAIIEGDDYWPLDKLKKQVSVMENDPDILLSYGQIVYDVAGLLRIYPLRWHEAVLSNDPAGSILYPFLCGENIILSQSVMIKKEALVSIGGFQPPGQSLYLIDYPTWMELALYGKFKYIQHILGVWRRHPTQITNQRSQELLIKQIEYLRYFIAHHAEPLSKINSIPFKLKQKPGSHNFFDLCREALLSGRYDCAKQYWREWCLCFIPPGKYFFMLSKLLSAFLKGFFRYVLMSILKQK